MKKIVGVMFQKKNDPNSFAGREYNYFTELDLSEGDIVVAPTSYGETIAMIVSTDVPESKVDERFLPLLKPIEKLYNPDEDKEDTACQQQ